MEMKAWRAAVVVVCFRAVFAEVAPRYETSSQVDHSAVLLSTVENLPSQAAFERLSVSESAASTQVDPLTPTPSTGGAPQHAVNKTAARSGKIKRKLARAPPPPTPILRTNSSQVSPLIASDFAQTVEWFQAVVANLAHMCS